MKPKYTFDQVKEMAFGAPSYANAIATLHRMMLEEIENARRAPTIRRDRIRFAVDGVCEDLGEQYKTNHAYAIAEAALAALGCTIVDDDPEVVESPEVDVDYEISKGTGVAGDSKFEQSRRLRTLHEAKELIEKLIQETADDRNAN